MHFHTVNQALPALSRYLMEQGEEVASRLGERTMETLHAEIDIISPRNRYVMVPFRKASLPAQIMETIWVLSGRNDIETILPYLPRAAEFSDDGVGWRGGYGPRIRRWGDSDEPVDQIRHVLETLEGDRTTRRAIVSIYDPAIDTKPGKDIPCNNWITFQSRSGVLNMHVAIRSNDLVWGWSGINQFEWSTLQEILAAMLGVDMGRAHYSISSLHVYDRHWKKARDMGQSHAPDFRSTHAPRFEINDAWMPADATTARARMDALDALFKRFLNMEKTIRRGMAPRHSIDHFPEPMMRSWLRVLAAYWADPEDQNYWLEGLAQTDLEFAYLETPANPAVVERKAAMRVHTGRGVEIFPPEITRMLQEAEDRPVRFLETFGEWIDSGVLKKPTDAINDVPPFTFDEYVGDLHEAKDAAYGDSWKRRGEMLGIMANIARKVDRLGVSDDNETSADTAVDLLVYLLKYERWLVGQWTDVTGDDVEWVRKGLSVLNGRPVPSLEYHMDQTSLEQSLRDGFEKLETLVTRREEPIRKRDLVVEMQHKAYLLAFRLWEAEQHG